MLFVEFCEMLTMIYKLFVIYQDLIKKFITEVSTPQNSVLLLVV